jgi:GxxExxY protein
MPDLIYHELTSKIIELAIKVHKALGPGFPEKIYQRAYYIELKSNSSLRFEREKKVTIKYNNIVIGY